MPGSVKQKKIDELMLKVREALQRSAWFEAERLAVKSLAMARQDQEFLRMADIVPLLWDARRHRMNHALQTGKITVVEGPVADDMKIARGCYLVQPPNVGSDARRLRLAALTAEVAVTVLCREPLTRMKLVPVVAISPQSTLRVKLDPPRNAKSPDMAWYVTALQSLGDSAVESLDPTLPLPRRIDALLDALDALPEHENLHLALEALCRQAHDEQHNSGAGKTAKSKIKAP